MARKKPSTSKNGKPKNHGAPKEITLADGSKVMERYHNDYGSKNVYADPGKKEKPSAPDDEASKHKYPPPKRNPIFRRKWMKFIDSVVGREQFREAHLEALEVLCDLYVEYSSLEETVRKEGRTYKSVTRFGETRKLHPAMGQLDKVRGNIAKYTRQLDLFPKKDVHGGDSDGEKDVWD